MEIMRFNKQGIVRFGQYLDSLTTDQPESYPELLLTDEQYTEAVGSDTSKLDNIDLTDKLKAARVLDEIVTDAGLDTAERDAGFWTWMSCYLFERLCKKNRNGDFKPEGREKWIAQPTVYTRYYRHLLAGIWHVYNAHSDNPEITIALLSGDVNTSGEVFGILAGSVNLVTNPVIMKISKSLYWDEENQTKKKGSGGKGAGSPRRFADIVSQYERTWDLFSIRVDKLIEMLPDEFSKFLKVV